MENITGHVRLIYTMILSREIINLLYLKCNHSSFFYHSIQIFNFTMYCWIRYFNQCDKGGIPYHLY